MTARLERPIRGPYAPDNGMKGVTSSANPVAVIAIGPALAFGYIATRHAAVAAC